MTNPCCMSRFGLADAATTMTMTPATDRLAARGRSHTQLRELLAVRESILHAGERDQLLDAADALLFDEPDGPAKQAAPNQLLANLVDAGRWETAPAEEARAALAACGATAEPAAF